MHTNPEVLALLALGENTGTPIERGHVDHCPVCSEEVAELARIADVGRTSTMSQSLTAPGPQVWQRIRVELGFDLTGDVLTEVTSDHHVHASASGATVIDLADRRSDEDDVGGPRRSSSARRFLALAVAAALALVVGVGAGIAYERQAVEPENRVIAVANLKPLPQFPGVSGTVEVTADGRGNRTLHVRMTSPQPITGQTEVWLMTSSNDLHPRAMGIMSDGTAEIPIQRGMSLFERPLVDISQEPAGDTDQLHSRTSILRGQLV